MDQEQVSNEDVARHGAPERDAARHTLTVKQVADLFAQLGSPRSSRSVQRFCEQKLIDAIPVTRDNGTVQYFIDPLSVERYAAELKQLQDISQIANDMSRHDTPERDIARHDAPKIDAPSISEPTPKIDHEAVELRERVDTLAKENMQLKIDLSARVVVINQMADERRSFFEQITAQSREIGRLETRVEMLDAPKPDVTRHDATEISQPIPLAATEQPREPIIAESKPPTPSVTEQRKRSIWQRIAGN
jgi:hypothetical protein